MSESFCIKTEPIAKDCEPEDCNNDTNTLSNSTTKLEHFTNMANDIKDEPALDKIEEYIPENVVEYTVNIIKEEDVDEMDEKDSPSFYSPSLLTWKPDDITEIITDDGVQHLTPTITQQISVPKLEIMDMHDSDGLEINGSNTDANVSDNKKSTQEVSIVLKKKHTCEQCGNSYTEVGSLWRHIRYKHPSSIDTEYICEICNQRFTTQTGLDIHSNKVHPGVQPSKHICEICGCCYGESFSLRSHIRKKHPASIGTEYICEICNQRFTTQKALNGHSNKTHPGAEPSKHKCELCGSCFTESGSLRAHTRKKHPSSIDSEYICEICNHRFTTQTGLDMHYNRMHPEPQKSNKHKCDVCGNSYKNSYVLQKHMRIKHASSMDLEYICEICNQRFTTQAGLKRHSHRVHPCERQSQLAESKTSILRKRKP
ncbi:uncharacterized protein isoform X2 [Musca autumnalis]